MNPREAQLAIALRRLAQSSRAAEFSAETACSPGKQLAAVKSPAKRKCKKCGRRAGKTTSDAVELLLEGLREPIVPELYVSLTRGNAKEILLPILTRINEEYKLGYRRVGDADFVSPIGVAIQLRGANDVKDIEKIRGHVFKRAHIDEPGSMPDRIIRPLVVDIIQPTLMDYQGPLVLSGTPPPLRHGYFYDCYAGKLKDNWEQYHWTVRDNERFPAKVRGLDIEAILAEIRRENAWGPDDPTYLREYEGLDIEDRKSLLFEYQSPPTVGGNTPAETITTNYRAEIGPTCWRGTWEPGQKTRSKTKKATRWPWGSWVGVAVTVSSTWLRNGERPGATSPVLQGLLIAWWIAITRRAWSSTRAG